MTTLITNIRHIFSNIHMFIDKYYKNIFSSILFLAAFIRIWVVYLSSKPWFSFDSYEYLKMADKITNHQPVSSYPNGYPLLISLLNIFFSQELIPFVLVTVNLISQLLVIYILERILNRYAINKSVILFSLLIFALYPNQINYSRLILTEPISTLLIILIIYFYSIERPFLLGFIGYLVSTFRPTMLPFIPLLLIFILKKKNKLFAIKVTSGFIVCILVFISFEFLGIIKPPDNLKINLLLSTKRTMGVEDKYTPADFTSEELAHPFETYIKSAVNNPSEFIKKRALAVWYLWGLGVDTRQGIWYLDLLIKIRAPLFLISCLVFLYRKKFNGLDELIEIFFIPVLLITVIHTFFFSGHRFTLVAEPSIIFLSVLGLYRYLAKLNFTRKILDK